MRYFKHSVLVFWFFSAIFSLILVLLAYNISTKESVQQPILSTTNKHLLIDDTASGIAMITTGEGNLWASNFQNDINIVMPSFNNDQKILFKNISQKLVLIQNAQTVDDKLNIYHSFENEIIPSLAI